MPKRFTLDEAERLLPQIEGYLRMALETKPEFDAAEQAMRTITERVMMMGGMILPREEVVGTRKSRDEAAAKLRHAVNLIQETGCVVKDLDIGLIDFPSFYDGREVYLCWKLGESGIGFWHGVEEGFAGRKAVDADFRARHQGDLAQ